MAVIQSNIGEQHCNENKLPNNHSLFELNLSCNLFPRYISQLPFPKPDAKIVDVNLRSHTQKRDIIFICENDKLPAPICILFISPSFFLIKLTIDLKS